MNSVIRDFRNAYPTFYKDLTDEQLTAALGEKFPGYLENDEFRDEFNRVTGQNRVRPSAAVNTSKSAIETKRDEELKLGILGSSGHGFMSGMGQTGAQVSGVAEATVAGIQQLRKALGIKGLDVPDPIGYAMLLGGATGYLFTSENTLEKLQKLFGGSREAGEEFARDWTAAFTAKGGSEFFHDVGAGAYSLAPTIAAIGLGWPGVMAAAGLQNVGGTFADARDQRIENGEPYDEATRGALLDSVMAGTKTALITRMFGKWGPEALLHLSNPAYREALKKVASKTVIKSLPDSARKFLTGTTSVALGAISEGLEEGIDQGLDGVLEMWRRNPNKSWSEIWDEGWRAAKVGAALGFGAQSIVSIEQTRGQKKLASVLQPYITDPNDPKLSQNQPDAGVLGGAVAPESPTPEPATQKPAEPATEPDRAQQMEARIAELRAQAGDPALGMIQQLQAKMQAERMQAELPKVRAEVQAEAEMAQRGEEQPEKKAVRKSRKKARDETDPYNPEPAEPGAFEEVLSDEDLKRVRLRQAIIDRAIQIQQNNELGRMELFSQPDRDPFVPPDYENPQAPEPAAKQSQQTWLDHMGALNSQLNALSTDGSMPDAEHLIATKTAFNLWSELTGRGHRPWRAYARDQINLLKEFFFSPAHGDARYNGHLTNEAGGRALAGEIAKVPFHSSEQAWARELMIATARGDHGRAVTALLRLEDFVNNSDNMLQDYALSALPEAARLERIGRESEQQQKQKTQDQPAPKAQPQQQQSKPGRVKIVDKDGNEIQLKWEEIGRSEAGIPMGSLGLEGEPDMEATYTPYGIDINPQRWNEADPAWRTALIRHEDGHALWEKLNPEQQSWVTELFKKSGESESTIATWAKQYHETDTEGFAQEWFSDQYETWKSLGPNTFVDPELEEFFKSENIEGGVGKVFDPYSKMSFKESAAQQPAQQPEVQDISEHYPDIRLQEGGAKFLDKAPSIGEVPGPKALPAGAQEAEVKTPPITFEDENRREADLRKLRKSDLERIARDEPILLDMQESLNFSKDDLVQHIMTRERQINNQINSLAWKLDRIRQRHGDDNMEATLTKLKIIQLGGELSPTGEKGVALAYKNIRTGQIVRGPNGEADISKMLVDQMPDVYQSPGEWEAGFFTDTGRFVSELQAMVDGVEITESLIRC